MNRHYPLVSRRAAHRCEYCRAPEATFNFPFEVEHVLPSSRGGGEDDSNLALGRRACNVYKTDHVEAQDPVSHEIVRLFHPRSDPWDEHFMIAASGEVTGRTAVGRATVALLRMNTPNQIAARLQWKSLGLFP